MNAPQVLMMQCLKKKKELYWTWEYVPFPKVKGFK